MPKRDVGATMRRAIKNLNDGGLDCETVIRASEESLASLFVSAGLDGQNIDHWRVLLAVFANELFPERKKRGRPSIRVGQEFDLLRAYTRAKGKLGNVSLSEVVEELKRQPDYENLQISSLQKRLTDTAKTYSFSLRHPTPHITSFPAHVPVTDPDPIEYALFRAWLSIAVGKASGLTRVKMRKTRRSIDAGSAAKKSTR